MKGSSYVSLASDKLGEDAGDSNSTINSWAARSLR